eukprot:TRINITY_DN5553_c0_g1_i1.p1 TRINITY_DN5553_c0_g1~~TRINITY_DN5553_c0_g1_i1.p1  ORF type:complete len:435 (+),score=32.30 TRINITY_DN5553_c0_g1_i1:28-1332(+)
MHEGRGGLRMDWGVLPLPQARTRRTASDLDLLNACRDGESRAAEEALSDGADVTACDASGLTPLHLAVWRGDCECLSVLLRHAASQRVSIETCAEGKSQFTGHTALHTAALLAGRSEALRALLAAGADDSAATPDGSRPLHCAAFAGRGDVLRLLLEHGADPDVQDKSGATPLMIAAGAGHTSLVRTLLTVGASTHIVDLRGCCAVGRAVSLPVARALDSDPTLSIRAHECVYLLTLSGADVTVGDALKYVPPYWRSAHESSYRHRSALRRGGLPPPVSCSSGQPLSPQRGALDDALAASRSGVPFASYLTADASTLRGWNIPEEEAGSLAEILHECWMSTLTDQGDVDKPPSKPKPRTEPTPAPPPPPPIPVKMLPEGVIARLVLAAKVGAAAVACSVSFWLGAVSERHMGYHVSANATLAWVLPDPWLPAAE